MPVRDRMRRRPSHFTAHCADTRCRTAPNPAPPRCTACRDGARSPPDPGSADPHPSRSAPPRPPRSVRRCGATPRRRRLSCRKANNSTTSSRAPFTRAIPSPFHRTRAQCGTAWMPCQSRRNGARATRSTSRLRFLSMPPNYPDPPIQLLAGRRPAGSSVSASQTPKSLPSHDILNENPTGGLASMSHGVTSFLPSRPSVAHSVHRRAIRAGGPLSSTPRVVRRSRVRSPPSL